ncbi:MAG: ABC transporter substrate-binding protein [Chloroflexota bacterium]
MAEHPGFELERNGGEAAAKQVMEVSRQSRRGVLGSTAAVVGAGALAACGPTDSGGTAPQARQPVTLKVNHRTEKYFAVRAEQFTEAHPWITVELVPNAGYEKLVALIAAGDLGDMVWASTGVGTYFELAHQGHFLQLDPLVARDKYNLKQFFPRAIDVAKTVEKKLYGLPNLIHPSHIGLFYNVNLFESAGVKPPTSNWTMDDLLDAAQRIKSADPNNWGMMTETAYAPLLCYLRSFGGEFLDPPTLGKQMAIDRGPAKQAFQFLFDLRHRHRVHPIEGVDKVSFTDGKLAMRTSGMWGMNDAKKLDGRFEMGAALIPKGPGGKRGSQGHVDMLAVGAKTAHQDEAWLLHQWFVSKETSPLLLQESGIPGARPDAWQAAVSDMPPMFKVFKDFMDNPGPGPLAVPWNYRMLEIGQVTKEVLQPMWQGKMSVDQTIGAAMGPYQQLLDKPRP